MVGQWDVETRSLFTCVLAGAGYVREVVSKPGEITHRTDAYNHAFAAYKLKSWLLPTY